VPRGQQLGKVPTGRSPKHTFGAGGGFFAGDWAGGGFGLVDGDCSTVPLVPPEPVLQLGKLPNVPGGHGGVCGVQTRPFQRSPVLHAHRPSDVGTIPPVQVPLGAVVLTPPEPVPVESGIFAQAGPAAPFISAQFSISLAPVSGRKRKVRVSFLSNLGRSAAALVQVKRPGPVFSHDQGALGPDWMLAEPATSPSAFTVSWMVSGPGMDAPPWFATTISKEQPPPPSVQEATVARLVRTRSGVPACGNAGGSGVGAVAGGLAGVSLTS
jgi:hypothetical protein